MAGLTKSQRLHLLLSKGYFPRELPPPFVTGSIAKHRASVLKQWKLLGDCKKSRYEVFSYPRIGRQRRKLALVNPIAQLFLSNEISNNWVSIKSKLKSSKISVDIPDLKKGGDRAVPKPDFNNVTLKRLDVSAKFNHTLLSDISRFYGTIYTHVVPWSLYGKQQSKRDQHKAKFKNSYENLIDVYLRKGQDNQTLGIPIGPDTSRIVAEIIAVGIEEQFLKMDGVTPDKTFRYVDDWFIGYDSAGDAENAINFLAKACSYYELELNNEKTRIIEPAEPIEELWPTELREHKISRSPVQQSRDIGHYFAKAFHFANEHPAKNVLDYALKRARSFQVNFKNYALFESYLLRAARVNPMVLPVVAQIVINLNSSGHAVSKERVSKLIHDTVLRCAPIGHHGELAWALFLAKGLKIKIKKKAVVAVESIESSVCALILLDLQQLGLLEKQINTSFWMTFMDADGLHSPMWLLAYEAHIKGWLAVQNSHVDNDPHFKLLKSKGVFFYDTKKNVEPYNRMAKRAKSSPRRLTWMYRYFESPSIAFDEPM